MEDTGALVFVDAVLFAPHHLVDVKELSCDFLAYSGTSFSDRIWVSSGDSGVIDFAFPLQGALRVGCKPEPICDGHPSIRGAGGPVGDCTLFSGNRLSHWSQRRRYGSQGLTMDGRRIRTVAIWVHCPAARLGYLTTPGQHISVQSAWALRASPWFVASGNFLRRKD